MCETSLQKHNILWIIMCNRLYQATTKMALWRENTNADSVLRNNFKNSRSCSIWGLFLASARPLLRLTPADEFWQIWTDTKSIKEPRLRQGSSRLNFNQLSTPAFGRLPTSPHRGIARWGFSSLAWRKCPEMADASIQPKSCIVTRCLAKTTQSNAIPSHNKDLFFDRSICCSPAWPSLYSISSISSSDSSKSPVSSLRYTTSLGDPNWCIECSIKYQAVISNSIVIYNYGSNMIKLDSNPKSLYHRNIGSCLNNLLRSWCILLLDQHGGYKSVWHTCDTEYDASQALECLASFRHSLFGPIGQWPLRNEGPKEFHGTTWNFMEVPFSFRDYQVGLVALHLLRSLPFSSKHKQQVVQSLCGCSGNRSCNKCRAVQKQTQGGITIWKIGQFTRLLPADVVETQVLPPPESRLDQTTSDDCRNKGELLSMPKLDKIQ